MIETPEPNLIVGMSGCRIQKSGACRFETGETNADCGGGSERDVRTSRGEGLKEGLDCLERREFDLKSERKGALWKVVLARYLREYNLVPNAWLSKNLFMGAPNSLSTLISRHRSLNGKTDKLWIKLQNQEYVD